MYAKKHVCMAKNTKYDIQPVCRQNIKLNTKHICPTFIIHDIHHIC